MSSTRQALRDPGPAPETGGRGLGRQLLRRRNWLTAGIVAIGIALTAIFAWGVSEADKNTEERLLEVQTRQAANVLSTAILAIERPMATALRVQAITGSTDKTRAFEESMRESVGVGKQFLSASLWARSGSDFTLLRSMGAPPGLAPESSETKEHLQRAAASTTYVVKQIEVKDGIRIAYALADPSSDLVVYAERAIPADRRAPVDRDSAFADLNYAIYIGPGTSMASLSTTNVDPSRLPFEGLVDRRAVPFGDTNLTLVTAPRHHLGSAISHRLPLIVLLGGALLTLASAFITRWLVRSRLQAESNTQTIATLYENVDSLYGQQRELFVQLQRALLPQVLPTLEGLEIASAYVAGADGVDIGGDWYSVVGTDGDHFAFVVGDVSGRGLDAVAVMAHARFTIRAYLIDGDSPEVALEKCSRQFDIAVDHHMTTVLVGTGNSRTGEMCVASAGHPLPLVLSDDGAQFVAVPVGPPLGTGPSTYSSTSFELPAGSSLIAYTDGLIERRAEDIDAGMQRLADVARAGAHKSTDDLVAHLLASLRSKDAPDDIATLILRRVRS